MNKERICVNTYLYALPQDQAYNLSIIPLHVADTVDKACPAKGIACQDPSWVARWEADTRILQTDTKDNF